MNAPLEWLLESSGYIAYRARRDLLVQAESEEAVASARREMLAHPPVLNLVAELSNWPGKVVSSHKSAGQPFHKLTFLADLGLTASDPGMSEIITRILASQSGEGPFQLPMNIPAAYGGSGQEQLGWALCDAPLTLYALAGFGLQDHPAVQAAAAHLAGLARDNGWPCAVSKALGSWRGPGHKQDPCPFASLSALKALSQFDSFRDSPACRAGAEAILSLWSDSRSRHPYIFYMGTDFRKLKVPFIWYDLLHVLDVLTRFAWLHGDPRLLDMLSVLKSKAGPDGRFTAESVWAAWKEWEFGQKKTPSRWLTLAAWRILYRLEPAGQPA